MSERDGYAFPLPRYTPVPDEVFDVWLTELSGWELKALLYICRRTFGFRIQQQTISIAQLMRGTAITRRATLIEALRGLRQKELIEVRGGEGKAKAYSLKFEVTCTESVHPRPGTENGPGPENGPGGGPENGPTPGTENGPGVIREQTSSLQTPSLQTSSDLPVDGSSPVQNTDSGQPPTDPQQPARPANWVARCCDAFSRIGSIPHGRMGAMLKPVSEAVGGEETCRRFCWYLAVADPDWASPSNFVTKWRTPQFTPPATWQPGDAVPNERQRGGSRPRAQAADSAPRGTRFAPDKAKDHAQARSRGLR